MIRARIDSDLKVRAESILGDLGLNASDAIRLLYTQITLTDRLPFDVRILRRGFSLDIPLSHNGPGRSAPDAQDQHLD
jgi:addiction module RelB/DinJ family antitoxin